MRMLVETHAAAPCTVPSTADSTLRGAVRATSWPAQRDGACEAAADPADALNLAQLLTSRMCHDLSGAIGVTASAEDIIGPGPELEADALALIADAGRRAAARLAFFRAAFGFSGTSRKMTRSEVQALIEPALDRPRLRFEWRENAQSAATEEAELSPLAGRIVLCLALIASEALPRGGTVRVVFGASSERSFTVEAEGPAARLTPQVLQALQAADCGGLTSSTVIGYYAQLLATRVAADIIPEVGDGSVCLSLSHARPDPENRSRRH